jgi:hypothetical protein
VGVCEDRVLHNVSGMLISALGINKNPTLEWSVGLFLIAAVT